MNYLVLRPSILENMQGGDIDSKNTVGQNGIELYLDSEDSFFTSDITKGLYLRNESPKGENVKMENISVSLVGAEISASDNVMTASLRYLDTLTREFEDERKQTFGEAFSTHTFIDLLNDRRIMNIPPYLPSNNDMNILSNVSAEEERTAFQDWFINNQLLTASARTSLFNQIEVGVNVPVVRNLFPVSEIDSSGYKLDFLPTNFLPTLYSGDYWGFFIQVDMNFIPDWVLEKDFCYMYVSWDEVNFEVTSGLETQISRTKKIAAPVRIKINATFGNINSLVEEAINRMYSNYPPYFAYYTEE